MALTLLNEPDLISLAKNPTVFEFSTDNEYSTAGVKHIQDIEFTSIPVNGNQITLEWLGGDVSKNLTFKTTPNDSGLEIKIQAFATVDQYVKDVLVDELRGVYELERDFKLSYQSPNKVRLESRFVGAGYEVSSTISGGFGGTVTIIQQGIDPERRPNFRVFGNLDIKYKGDADSKRVEVELIPIESKVVFDLSSILRNYDKFRLTPALRELPYEITNQIIQYECAFAEAFGTTLQVQKLAIYSAKYGLCGGYNLRDFLGNSFNDDHLPNFLTAKAEVNIFPNMPYFLNYCNNSTGLNLVLRGIFNYTDGTTENKTIQSFTAGAISLWSLPVSYSVLQALSAVGKVLKSVSAFIANSSAPDTELNDPIRLVLNNDPTLDSFLLSYRNYFGVQEVIQLNGLVRKTVSVDADESGVWQRYDAGIENRRSVLIGNKHVTSWEVSTGYLGTNDAEQFQDLLASESHFLISNSTYIPVILRATKHQVKETKSRKLNSYTIEVSLHPDNNYSDVGNTIG